MITIKNSATLAGISELRNKSEEILARLKENRVILERHGKPVAVMVDYAQYEKFEAMLEDRKSTRLNSSHIQKSRMPSSA